MLSAWLRGRGMARKAAAPPAHPAAAQRLVVLQEGPSASADYILLPWLQRQGPPVACLDVRLPPAPGDLQPGDFVVVLRYLHPAWRRQLERCRERLAGLAWFLDDDLLDPVALDELPPAYAAKLRRLGMRQRTWFERHGAAWWLATPALAARYPENSPLVLPLDPPAALVQTSTAAVRVVYDGSASHAAEMDWLWWVIADVQSKNASTHFEIYGDIAVNRRWRELPRVAVIHPMSWPNYLAHTGARRADIGLAPLLPGRFNAGRGPVKMIDYTRQGAIGLYSRRAPYEGYVLDGEDGVLLPDDPAAWVEAILQWAADADGRARLAAAARRRLTAR